MTSHRPTLFVTVALVSSWAVVGCRNHEPVPEPVVEAAEPDPEIVALQKEEAKVEGAGRYRGIRTHQFDPSLTHEQRMLVEQLEAIGYATGSRPGEGLQGVTVHDETRAAQGLNLLTSGHGQVTQLMDMRGQILHEWTADFWDIWPEFPVARKKTGTQYFRHVHLFDNGDLLAIYEGMGVVKLDARSRVLWANPCRAHHDLEVQPDGRIFTLTREAHLVPRVDPVLPVLEDYITILDPDGGIVRRISVLECFENAPRFAGAWRDTWKANTEAEGDMFHTNAVRVLDGSLAGLGDAFAAGNLLLSSHTQSALFVVDPDRQEVVWLHRGGFSRQHDPRVLADGHLLLFDNRGLHTRSRVLELVPPTMEVVWEYSGTDQAPFYSHTCGLAQRLPNGNTLVTESDNGRVFEVTSDHEIVWEYYNPHRAGEHDEFIATVVEMVRVPPDFPHGWATTR